MPGEISTLLNGSYNWNSRGKRYTTRMYTYHTIGYYFSRYYVHVVICIHVCNIGVMLMYNYACSAVLYMYVHVQSTCISMYCTCICMYMHGCDCGMCLYVCGGIRSERSFNWFLTRQMSFKYHTNIFYSCRIKSALHVQLVNRYDSTTLGGEVD